MSAAQAMPAGPEPTMPILKPRGSMYGTLLQPADGDRLKRLADDAHAFTLRLLRADAAADSGQQIAGGNRVVGAAQILVADRLDELRDVDVDRTAGDTARIRAEQAALRFVERFFQRIAAIDFVKVFDPYLRVLFTYWSPLLRDSSNCFLLLSGHR